MAATHPAVAQAREGRVSADGVADYLASLGFLFSQTVPHMKKARVQALRLGHERLVPFFERKIAEETGHERWAESDLRELVRHAGRQVDGRPLPAILELCEYLNELIETDPRLYIVYALATEYFTVLAGPTWVQLLSENCGVPLDALTAASKHIEADREHAAEGLSGLDEMMPDPALAADARGTIDRMMRLFDQFFREVVSAPT